MTLHGDRRSLGYAARVFLCISGAVVLAAVLACGCASQTRPAHSAPDVAVSSPSATRDAQAPEAEQEDPAQQAGDPQAAAEAPQAGPRQTVKLRVPAQPEVVVASKRYRKDYVLAAQDGLEVNVLKHPEVSRACVVRPDGYISLPILDDVMAAGLTPKELDAKLVELLSARLRSPEVTVVVVAPRPPVVYVVGEVGRPMAIPLVSATTALHAIANAGGFTTVSAKRSVMLIRVTEDNYLTATQIVVDTSGRGSVYLALQNVPLRADDILYVPRKYISRLTLFFDQNINSILSSVNSVLSTYNQVRMVEIMDLNVKQMQKQDKTDPMTQVQQLMNTVQSIQSIK